MCMVPRQIKKPYLVPIPGTRKLERLEENAGASDILLTPEEVKKNRCYA